MSTPQGTVQILISPDGRVIAHAACFDRGAPAGFSTDEMQAIQCRGRLAFATIEAMGSPALVNAIDRYDAEKIVSKMTAQGYRVETIQIGATE